MPEDKEEPRVTKKYIQDHTDGKEIDLSVCSLSTVPVKELAKFPRGVILDLSKNKLTHLPESFASLVHLVELDLSDNQLIELPANFGELSQLQKLDLYRNQLSCLPLSFAELGQLRWLDLRGNKLDSKLALAAGDCTNDRECRECASRVKTLLKKRLEEEEEKKKKRQRKQKARAEHRAEEEQRRKEELKKKKAEEKKKRKELWEQKQEMKDEEQQNLLQNADDHASENHSGNVLATKSAKKRRSTWKGCLCWLLLLSILVLLTGIAFEVLTENEPVRLGVSVNHLFDRFKAMIEQAIHHFAS